MSDDGGTTLLVEGWLELLRDPETDAGRQARDELIVHTKHRMELLCRKMFYDSLKGVPVIDWQDVYQEAALKLWKSLKEVRPLNVREFFGLATKKIREVLLDLCRNVVRNPPPMNDPSGSSFDPVTGAKWAEFHEKVTQLDPTLREVFELLWYQELTQREVAAILAIDESTVKRRWRKAREQLAEHVV